MASTARLSAPFRSWISQLAIPSAGPVRSRPMHDTLHYYVSCVNRSCELQEAHMTTAGTATSPIDVRERLLSAAELACAAWIVIGHNVFRIFPNEVPILAV